MVCAELTIRVFSPNDGSRKPCGVGYFSRSDVSARGGCRTHAARYPARLIRDQPFEQQLFVRLYICMYVCIYIYIYACISLSLSISLSLYIYIHIIYVYFSLSLSIYIYAYTCVYTYIHIYIYIYTCIHTRDSLYARYFQ